MKILLVHNILWSSYKGEVFSYLHALVKETEHQVSFVQIAETSEERKGMGAIDLQFHRYPYQLLFKGAHQATPWHKRCVKLVAVFWRTDPDIVVIPAYAEIEYWVLLLVARFRGVSAVIALDSTRLDNPKRLRTELLKKLFVSQCVSGLCYGVRSASYLHELGMALDKIYVRCQAAPNNYILSVSEDSSAKVAVPLQGKYWLLYVGRLSPEKDLPTLIEAMKRVDPALELVLIGEGPQRAELEALVSESGLSSRVHFLGGKNLHDLVPYYASALALVLPSRREPWGLVVNEAMVLGCPVIVSDHCGCFPELVREGETGFGFAAGSVDGLVSAIGKITSPDLDMPRVKARCRQVISEFTPEVAARSMLEGILDIAAK